MQLNLKIEKAKTSDLVPYAGNAKIHSAQQIEQIANSIEQFGFCDPVGVWTRPDGLPEIVEGHGRVMAANLLGIDTIPVIRLDHLDDDARRAYVHVHNQTTLSSGFDLEALEMDLSSIPNFDWEQFGFDMAEPLDPSYFDTDVLNESKEGKSETVTCPECGAEFEL